MSGFISSYRAGISAHVYTWRVPCRSHGIIIAPLSSHPIAYMPESLRERLPTLRNSLNRIASRSLGTAPNRSSNCFKSSEHFLTRMPADIRNDHVYLRAPDGVSFRFKAQEPADMNASGLLDEADTILLTFGA
ncbi:hypothetical protein CVT25_009998 [Psilocybe cyanescens]|uniref:Uncharacterized protein n=1 Tax=Psilocybe cyanescens TaxID=93625 RepID=A0A409XGR3_PSICY|nr:hypothetical protein CVT25_009998 [Psilocybe cyanescens]